MKELKSSTIIISTVLAILLPFLLVFGVIFYAKQDSQPLSSKNTETKAKEVNKEKFINKESKNSVDENNKIEEKSKTESLSNNPSIKLPTKNTPSKIPQTQKDIENALTNKQDETKKDTKPETTKKGSLDDKADPSTIDIILNDGGQDAIKTLEEVKTRIIGKWRGVNNPPEYITFYDDGSFETLSTGHNNINISVEGRYSFSSYKNLKLAYSTELFFTTDNSIPPEKKLSSHNDVRTIRLMNYDILYFDIYPLYLSNVKFKKLI